MIPGNLSVQHSAATQRTDNQSDLTIAQGRGFPQPQQSAPLFNQQILFLLLQLIQLLLQNINQPKPEPEPKPLQLNQSQQDNLKELLGVNPNAPFGVQVLDSDGSGALSAGDTAIVNGGITGGEIQRKVLTDDDIAQINTPKNNVPADFTANQQKWQSFAGDPEASLSYTTQQSCFCPSEFTRAMNITEFGGEITSATYVDTGEAVPDNIRQALQTVDERFAQLENAYASGADQIDVSYDPQFGYPTSVFIDQSQMLADEEISYSISGLGIALP